MMAKSRSQISRESEARKRDAGLREIRVWVPDDPASVEEVREVAARLVKKRMDALEAGSAGQATSSKEAVAAHKSN